MKRNEWPRYYRSAGGWGLSDSRDEFAGVVRQSLESLSRTVVRLAPFLAFAAVWALVFVVAFQAFH
jgi:hypothetical protein